MKIQEAIQKAVEGGYKIAGMQYATNRNVFIAGLDRDRQSYILLDPLFWQAIGKSMGWYRESCFLCLSEKNRCGCEGLYMPTWKYQMHCLIDHLAEGGTIESYFTNLT